MLQSCQKPDYHVPMVEKGSESCQRRERFLQRVVEQIEQDRLHRHLKSHGSSKTRGHQTSPGDRSPQRSLVSDDSRGKEGEKDDSQSKYSKGRPLKSLSPGSMETLTGYVNGDDRFLCVHKDVSSAGHESGDQTTKFRQISLRTARDKVTADTDQYHVTRVSQQSGPFYGFQGSRETDPRDLAVRSNMFSWKICTPTNWKRAKSQHEILLERRWLRRHGRRRSQSKFYSVFKVKDAKKLTAGDRIRKVLRRAQYHGDDIKRLPLVRFRRAVRTLIALLKTVKLSRQKGKGYEPSTWIDEDDIRASRRAYEMFGITFDAYSYRARKEFQVTNEAKAILSMAPGTRSEEQQHVALVTLSQAVPEFGEFPIAMQEALVRVGWYETFEARRIIIREGHMADNFYLILSGTAVVTIREQNTSGDYFGRTAAVLQKGNSFGELALIYGGKRSATVTCKDNVELLAVGRDDYIDIFMHKSKDGGEPEHIKFLKQIKVFCGWPIHCLPLDDPSVFLYTYVRRSMVLCKDSNKSEWIYVIKSGSCRVLTALHAVKPSIQGSENRWDTVVLVSGSGSKTGDERHNIIQPPHSRRSGRLSPILSRDSGSHQKLTRSCRLPSIDSRPDHEVQAAAAEHLQQLDDILRKRNTQPTLVTELPHGDKDDSKQRSKKDRIFVNLQTLQPKDVYGLESVVFSVYKQPTSTSLVSDGAECIMINKKFFQQKLTEDVAKKIRTEIRPLPSEEVLQEKLQTKTDWDTFRAITVADFVDFRRHVQIFSEL